MRVQVFEDNKAMANAFQSILGNQYDITIIDSNHIPAECTCHKQTALHGLDIALREVRAGKSVMIYGFESEGELMADARFAKLMAMKSVGYVQAPFLFGDLPAICDQIVNGTRTEDTMLAII